MHRAVLGRLLVARRRVVPVTDLVDDLWVAPPEGAVSAVRTFVAALRRALEPDRPARAPARLLVTQGPGYALDIDSGLPLRDEGGWGPYEPWVRPLLEPGSSLAAVLRSHHVTA